MAPGFHTLARGLVVNRLVFHLRPADYHRLVYSGLSYPASVVAAGKPPTSPLLFIQLNVTGFRPRSAYWWCTYYFLHTVSLPLDCLRLLSHEQSSFASYRQLPASYLDQTIYCSTYNKLRISSPTKSLADYHHYSKIFKRINSLKNKTVFWVLYHVGYQLNNRLENKFMLRPTLNVSSW